MAKRTRLVAVGACAIDSILTVPWFPPEDSKLRATSLHKRRGGNGPNSLEVLQQLVAHDTSDAGFQHDRWERERTDAHTPSLELYLISSLPSQNSPQISFIASSFDSSSVTQNKIVRRDRCPPMVDLSQCIYHPDYVEPVSSYIIHSDANSTRTIINHNALPEMTFSQFKTRVDTLLEMGDHLDSTLDRMWFHFEGRIPSVTLECMDYLRNHQAFNNHNTAHGAGDSPRLVISVELEKAGREFLPLLAEKSDVVFYSRSWVEPQGYSSAEEFLNAQTEQPIESPIVPATKLLICTWGAEGACAVRIPAGGMNPIRDGSIVRSPAYKSESDGIVDTTGAGDSFIAGALFGLICRNGDEHDHHDGQQKSWSLQQTLDFANGVAGRKILQHGFKSLGVQTRVLREALDRGGSAVS